jgi:hypothetical protein
VIGARRRRFALADQLALACAQRMLCVEDTCFGINDGNHITFHDHEDPLSRLVCSLRDPVTVALVKKDVVFPDLVGYTVVSRLCKAVLGYRDEVLFFDGEYLCRYLFCCPMLFGISRPLQPGEAVTIEIIDIIQNAMLGESVLRILDHRLNTLSEYSDNVYYPQFFIIRTF